MTAGTQQPYGVPGLVNAHLRLRHHGDPRQVERVTVLRGNADADDVCTHGTAGILPAPLDLEPARHHLGRLWRENPAGKNHIRAVGINLRDGFQRQCRQVHRAHAETGHPAGRTVGMGNALDHFAKLGWRAFVAAKAPWDQCAIHTVGLEGVDDIPRDMTLPIKLTKSSTIPNTVKQRFKGRTTGKRRRRQYVRHAKRIHRETPSSVTV
ncbi:hypothetical protein D9M71_128850 [compost metagenome]